MENQTKPNSANGKSAESQILVIKDGQVQSNAKLDSTIYKLLNSGFAVKVNEASHTLTAKRSGKKGDVNIQFLANQAIVTRKSEAPVAVDYENLDAVIAKEEAMEATV